jgi:hypothetical protein
MKPKIVLALSVLLIAAGCTVFREYPIEVYSPAELTLPPQASRVAIVYRAFKYPGDTLDHYYKNNFRLMRAKNDPPRFDSLLVTTCMNELANRLRSQSSFKEIQMLPFNTFKRHTGSHLSDLPADVIRKITDATNSDLLIALETYSSFFSVYPETFGTPQAHEVITVAVWSVYDPKQNIRVERKSMIDTVFWNGYDDEGNHLKGYRPPPRRTALELASSLAGEAYARRFQPRWETVNRIFSVPPLPDFTEAALLFEAGKTDDAIELWKRYAADRNGKMAIHARFNLALAYELKDNLERSRQWLSAAYDLAQKHRSKK